MYDGAEPISYEGVQPGVPLLSSEGHEFGTLKKVLAVESEDLFDGVIVSTPAGERFVDRDQINEITTMYITCALDDAAAAALPEPDGDRVYEADPLQDEGGTLRDWVGRTFRRGSWKQDK